MNTTLALNKIGELNLDPIRNKLINKESGEGWSPEHACAVEFEYRRFLCLMKLFPNEQVAPLVDVDIFWHHHILDTMKYATDCDQIFGYFLHHSPDNGERGEDDVATRNRTGARMQELHEATFGEAYIRQERHAVLAWRAPAAATPAWCQPATAISAFCQPSMPKTAFCQPTVAQTAWCQPATTKSAWCQPAKANTSFQAAALT